MELRTRLGRDMDLGLWSNRLAIAITAGSAIVAGIRVLAGEDARMLLTPALVFGLWALMREIDPDTEWTAIAASAVGAAWGVAGQSVDTWVATFALMFAARLAVNTTGSRPYTSDLIAVGVFAVAVSANIWGWVAGFGVAVAIYVDNRMAKEHKTNGVVMSAVTALGASVVATAARVFPQETPEFQPGIVVVAGLLALVMLGRDPAEPRSVVDGASKHPIVHTRLHAGRSLVAVNVFAAALLAGAAAVAALPWIVCLALAVVSSEAERLHRRRG